MLKDLCLPKYTNSKCQASLIYITKCHMERDLATCLLKGRETVYRSVITHSLHKSSAAPPGTAWPYYYPQTLSCQPRYFSIYSLTVMLCQVVHGMISAKGWHQKVNMLILMCWCEVGTMLTLFSTLDLCIILQKFWLGDDAKGDIRSKLLHQYQYFIKTKCQPDACDAKGELQVICVWILIYTIFTPTIKEVF